jgi:hypothetical protein
MTRTLTVLATATSLAAASFAVPSTADARIRGFGIAAGVIGGLAAGAILGSVARGGYYYGGYGYAPSYYGYTPYYGYGDAYAPAYYGYTPGYAYAPGYYGYGYYRRHRDFQTDGLRFE